MSKPIDIHPYTPVAALRRDFDPEQLDAQFPEDLIAALTGMQSTFVHKALGKKRKPTICLRDVLLLLDQDAFAETFVPRSKIPTYLLSLISQPPVQPLAIVEPHTLVKGSATDLLQTLPDHSVQCLVTSTPYWATRLYPVHVDVLWADGEVCAFGHEQTPDGFIRHTTELLYLVKNKMTPNGSIWWNLGDTYNTRTQIRENASETLNAMKGHDSRSWKDYDCRRYSAGHSYLKDGEQCLIPNRVAERASRIGYWVKSVISWKKLGGTLPEPVETRVGREVEYIIHLALDRSPYIDKEGYRRLPSQLGGRYASHEEDKITDVWTFPTASGSEGHGAQFPLALPGRCIALSTKEGDLVLDPFMGGGTTAAAAARLNRRSIGFDVNPDFIEKARRAANGAPLYQQEAAAVQTALQPAGGETAQGYLLADDTE